MQHRLRTPAGTLTWPPHKSLSRMFPFKQMAVGEAFYVYTNEMKPQEYIKLLERIRRYNNTYMVKFWKVRHSEVMIEIARIA